MAEIPELPLSPELLEAIAAGVRLGKGSQPSQAEVKRVVEWIEQVCVNASFVQGILGGDMAVRFPAGAEPRFSLTTKGNARVEAMLKRG